MMRMAMGDEEPMKLLVLRLGSKPLPSGTQQASHTMPPGMNMGSALLLKSHKPEKTAPVSIVSNRISNALCFIFCCSGVAARQRAPVNR